MIPQEHQVFIFEAKLLRLGSRDIVRKDVDKDGNKIVYGGLQRTITLEVERDAHEALEAIPRGALLRGKLYWTNGDEDEEIELAPEKPAPAKPKKEPVSKGPHGKFWQQVERTNLFSHPHLQEWLKQQQAAPDVGMAEIIRATFGVTSRAQIAPGELLARLEQDLPAAALDSLRITLQRLTEQVGT